MWVDAAWSGEPFHDVAELLEAAFELEDKMLGSPTSCPHFDEEDEWLDEEEWEDAA